MRIVLSGLGSICIVSILLLQGCSTTSSIGPSAGIGAGLGAGIGALADPGLKGQNRFRNVFIGAAIGTAVGAGTGALLDQNSRNQKEDGRKEAQKELEEELKRRPSPDNSKAEPRLIPPRTEAKWVPEQIKGNTFIPAHFEYLIIEQAHWDGI